MDIIKKDRNHIFYNPNNTIFPESAPKNSHKIYDEKEYKQQDQQMYNQEK